jgi:hypothetical protein
MQSLGPAALSTMHARGDLWLRITRLPAEARRRMERL